MQKSHSANDLIIALAVVRVTHWLSLPRWAEISFSFLGRSSFFSQEFYMYFFTDLHQQIASWPKLLFPYWTIFCPILDCSILNPFSKCVFVLSRIFRENQLPYLSKKTLGCIHSCGLGKRKDAREVLSLCRHRGREHGLANLLNRSVSLKVCELVSKHSILVKQALT